MRLTVASNRQARQRAETADLSVWQNRLETHKPDVTIAESLVIGIINVNLRGGGIQGRKP